MLHSMCGAPTIGCRTILDNSKWRKGAPAFTVECISAESCSGPGYALRHIDSLDLIKGDFILLSGDVVANFKLDKVLSLHKERVKADSRNIATMVLKKAAPTHRTRTLDDDLAVALCADSSHLLQFENSAKAKTCKLQTQLLEERRAVEFRYDLMDCHIDIISQEGMLLFADNPDWDSRESFITGVLADEMLGNKIHAHVIGGDYAARVQDLRTYDSVSKDIIQRWTYPLVPDNNLLGTTNYKFTRPNVYKEASVQHARSCVIGENTIVGGGTTICHHTSIDHSVIGPNCVIGERAKITNSYLWGSCSIEDSVVIDRAIICQGAVIKKNAVIGAGCVVSFNVTIGEGFQLAPYTKLTTLSPTRWAIEEKKTVRCSSKVRKGDSGEDALKGASLKRSTSAGNIPEEVGSNGIGRIYPDDEDATINAINTIAPKVSCTPWTCTSGRGTH